MPDLLRRYLVKPVRWYPGMQPRSLFEAFPEIDRVRIVFLAQTGLHEFLDDQDRAGYQA